MQPAELAGLFSQPSAAFRGKPFWCWNGPLDRSELLRQIHVLRDMGMGGFFMHSRTGLATEYLGDEWFDLINACADEAQQLGMEAWLYDEDRWPSGTAGGMVTAEPAHRMKFLHLRVADGQADLWRPETVAAFLCDLEGLVLHCSARLPRPDGLGAGVGAPTGPGAPALPTGQGLLAFDLVEMAQSSFYNGYTYVDTLSRDATDRFIELTHEKYADRCGGRLGSSIKGIFTDEPHRGALMDPFGGAMDCPNQVPWTEGLPTAYAEAFGEDLLDHLPELFLVPQGRRVSAVKWRYCELTLRLFLGNFLRPVDDWCRSHGIILTGHVLHEDSLTAQTSMNGSMMRCYEAMEWPGIDLLTEGNRAYWVAKQLQSAADQLGRPWRLSELYGCTGWQMPFAGHKAVGDWQALFGVNVRCQHLSWYTMEGEAKRDFPASIFDQSAWWRDYAVVEDYFSRLGVLLSAGSRVCDTLVVHPVESVWAQVHQGWSNFLGPLDPHIADLDKRFAETFMWLQSAQVDFDYGDEEMMSRLASVEAADDGAPLLRLGEMRYRTAVVSGMATIRSSTLDLLDAFRAAGGTVLFLGDAPEYVDAEPSPRAADLAAVACRLPAVPGSVEHALSTGLLRRAAFVTADSDLHDPVFCQVRRDGDQTLVVALNTNREAATGRIQLHVEATGAVERWDCLTGERQPASADCANGWTAITLDLSAAGEAAFVIDAASDAAATDAVEPEVVATFEVEGPFRYRLAEPNLCVLDIADLSIDGVPVAASLEVLKADQAVRDHFGLVHRGGEMLQPWFSGRREHPVLGRVACEYRFEVEALPEGDVELAVERPGDFALTLNGVPVDAAPGGRWVDVCFRRVALPAGSLRLGANVLRLECDFSEDKGLEALYLLGSFGVRIDGHRKTLTTLPETLSVGDIAAQGLPFYSAQIALQAQVGIPEAGRRVMLHVGDASAACVAVAGCGSRRVLPWAPFEADVTDMIGPDGCVELELSLTRRNTFGPLHQNPIHAPGYGPGNFVTDGPGFSLDYMLWPAGLLAAPRVTVSI